eukprot:CAMPEP_0197875972 /NCGR_PEP_ID=MMETSP1439-20131203/5091_1 /TAXON_ID=66791 /ORGANISM="Gonyaulax spinifera, Strain CCMP409" /LENGTH=183 /DNA_ID=CAMNT_0043495229 /DNA_START=122 /DNA_END=673 /DNA_ORIENTATION=-
MRRTRRTTTFRTTAHSQLPGQGADLSCTADREAWAAFMDVDVAVSTVPGVLFRGLAAPHSRQGPVVGSLTRNVRQDRLPPTGPSQHQVELGHIYLGPENREAPIPRDEGVSSEDHECEPPDAEEGAESDLRDTEPTTPVGLPSWPGKERGIIDGVDRAPRAVVWKHAKSFSRVQRYMGADDVG